MEDFFSSMYYWTNSFYSTELDDYLYETVPGYLHNGLVLVISTFIFFMVFYYIFKPVRKQTFWWFMFFAFDAVINFIYALYYTMSPLINNEIDSSKCWTNLDCIFFGVSDIIWAFVAYLLFSLFFKWWSPCKYVPFQIF